MVNIQEMIKRIMMYYGLTQEEFAVKYKYQPCQVSRWIHGKAVPRAETYAEILDEYNSIGPPILIQ